MKKYLLLFLILILFIPNVMAEEGFTGQIIRDFTDGDLIPVAETSCSINLAPNIFNNSFNTSSISLAHSTKTFAYSSYLIPVFSGITYTVHVPINGWTNVSDFFFIYPVNENFEVITSDKISFKYDEVSKKSNYDFVIPDNISYIFVSIRNSSRDITFVRDFGIFLKSDFDNTGYVSYEVCSSEPNIPDTPDIPDNPHYSGDQVQLLSNFYSIYFDKIKLLTSYAQDNFLFLSFVGVILLFIILEIFLNLFSIKRRRM